MSLKIAEVTKLFTLRLDSGLTLVRDVRRR